MRSELKKLPFYYMLSNAMSKFERDYALEQISIIDELYNKSVAYENERKEHGGISKPYPALFLPEPSTSGFTEKDPHWTMYVPKK
jgi:hypothetical protein